MELSKGRGIAPAVGIVVSGPVSVGDATSSDEVKSAVAFGGNHVPEVAMVAVMFAPAVDTMMGWQAETVTVTPSLTDSRAALAWAARPTRMAGRARRIWLVMCPRTAPRKSGWLEVVGEADMIARQVGLELVEGR